MKHHLLAAGLLATLVVVSLSAAPAIDAQTVRRDTVPRAAQKPAPRRASVDSLVECSPVAAPAKAKPVVRHRKRGVPAKKAAPAAVAAPKPRPKAVVARRRRPVTHTVKRATPKAAAPAHTTTVVMCRPVRPLAPLAQGMPTETSVIPVPQLATVPPTPPMEDGPPLFVSTAPGAPVIATAGNGGSWLPLSVIPAVFIPFIHSGRTHPGRTAPTDSIPPRDTLPTTPPPVIPPPTTVPEPGMLVMLGSGLLGLAGVAARKRKL